MPDTMIEIDIEDLFAGSMSFEKPVLRGTVLDGLLLDISDDVLAIESFTSTGIVMSLVYGVGVLTEIDIEDLIEPVGMSYEKPVLWQAVNAGTFAEIVLGARPPWPGDTMTILEFDEDVPYDFSPGIAAGTIFVGVTSRSGVLLGNISDAVVGFNRLGLIRFLVSGQNIDVLE
jgi:hypothetical protein